MPNRNRAPDPQEPPRVRGAGLQINWQLMVDPAAAMEDRERAIREINNRWANPRDLRAFEQMFWNEPRNVRVVGRGGEVFVVGRDEPVKVNNGLKRGEELFKLVLSGIKEVYDVDAAIAGGAVRDLVTGAEPADVDVFIPMKWEDFQANQRMLGWREPAVVINKQPYNQNKSPEFQSSKRAQAYVQGIILDLVFIDQPLNPEMVDTFPVHAQRCVWTLADGLIVSPLAQKDIDNKTFTIDPSITNKLYLKHLKERVAAWQRRFTYKDWTLTPVKIKEWWVEANNRYNKDRMPF